MYVTREIILSATLIFMCLHLRNDRISDVDYGYLRLALSIKHVLELRRSYCGALSIPALQSHISLGHSYSWEADSSLGRKKLVALHEIHRLSLQKIPPLDVILSRFNPFHTLHLILLRSIFPHTSRSPEAVSSLQAYRLKNVFPFLTSPVYTSFFAHFIFLDLIPLTIPVQEDH